MTDERARSRSLVRGWMFLLAGLLLLLATTRRTFACTPTIACLDCQDNGDGTYTAAAGQDVTFRLWPTGCAVLTTDWRVDGATASYQTGAQYKFYYTFPDATEPGTPHTVRAVIEHDSGGGAPIPTGSNTVSVHVTAGAFTVNVIPTTGCTVLSGDGGVDDAEPEGNGIVCSGSMAANDPLCTEQFENSQIASLKVVPEPGHVFTGWTVNGAQINASAEPLFLTTMPVLAQTGDFITPFTGNTAVCQANCSNVTITTPDSVQRDEIFDVTLTLDPPPLWGGMAVTFDLDGQKTQNLPERGTVQMYDFGYDIDDDGDIDPNQTSYIVNPLLDGGTKTIKAVYNLYQPPQIITILASVGGYVFESQPIAVTYQVRQYTTMYGNTPVNSYDHFITQWADYWTHWHYPDEENPYTFKVTDDVTYDLIKAICYRESTMKEVDLMSVLAEEQTLQALHGPKVVPRDWNWKATPDANNQYVLEKEEIVVPPQDLSNAGAVFMKYSDATVTTASDSIKWGIRWFYSKRSKYTGYDPDTGKAYNPIWFNIEDTLQRYGDQTPTYKDKIMNLYNYGKNPNFGDPVYLWPIMSNGHPRN